MVPTTIVGCRNPNYKKQVMHKVLIIDNYDSFTYNLVHYLEALGAQVKVVRNDKLHIASILNFQKIIISPGSGLPNKSGQLINFLKEHKTTKSILGICLGQQAIAEIFGGELSQLNNVNHGISTAVNHFNNDVIYTEIPKVFQAGLYHSWETKNLSRELITTALSESGIIMSFRHIKYDVRAVQYHPESILTPFGKTILKNWLNK